MQDHGHHLVPLSKFRSDDFSPHSSHDRLLKVIAKAYGHGSMYRTIQGTPWSGLAKMMVGGTVHHALKDGIHNFPPFIEVSTVLVMFC